MDNDLGQIVDALPGLVWTAHPDGSVEFLNTRWFEYTGLSRDDVSNLGWQSAIHADDVGQLLTTWKSICTSGKPGEMEARLRRHDGPYRWFLFRASPMLSASVKWPDGLSSIPTSKTGERPRKPNSRLKNGFD